MRVAIRDIMTEQMIRVHPDTSVEEAASLLLRHGVSGLPVTHEDGRLAGVLSEYDLLEHLLRGAPDGESIGQYMTANVRSVSPDDDAIQVARIFREEHFRRLPVVEDGRLVGLVSRRDLMRLVVSLRSLGELDQPAELAAGEVSA